MAASPDWLVWQLADSAFPTGGFAHSWGLESAWQQGEVAGPTALGRFVQATILQTAHTVLPLVNAAHRAPDRLAELDALNDAFLTNVVSNRASRVQGRTLAASAARVWPRPELQTLQATIPALCAHVAPMTGVVFRTLDLPLDTTQRLVMYAAVRGVVSAAVRLGIAGSYEAQRLQSECTPALQSVLDRSAAFDEHDLAQTAPVLDILQGAHDRLYSRLFQS